MAAFSRGVLGLKRIPSTAQPFIANSTRQGRESLKDVNDNFRKLIKHIEGQSVFAVQFALQPMMEKALYYVPKDTLALYESGYLVVESKQNAVIAEIGFGASNASPMAFGRLRPADYAAMIHERPDLYHEPPTRYKFLQAAMQEHMSDVMPRLGEFLKGVMQ